MFHKWKAPATPIEQERGQNIVTPTTFDLDKAVIGDVKRWMKRPTKEDAKIPDHIREVAGAFIISGAKKKEFTNAIEQKFMAGFWNWLMGQGTDAEVSRTHWGRQSLLVDAEVRAYLEMLLFKRYEYMVQLQLMRMRIPRGINQAYLYYKYLVKSTIDLSNMKVGDDQFGFPSTTDYLKDFDRFVEAFNADTLQQPALRTEYPAQPRPYYSEKNPVPPLAAGEPPPAPGSTDGLGAYEGDRAYKPKEEETEESSSSTEVRFKQKDDKGKKEEVEVPSEAADESAVADTLSKPTEALSNTADALNNATEKLAQVVDKLDAINNAPDPEMLRKKVEELHEKHAKVLELKDSELKWTVQTMMERQQEERTKIGTDLKQLAEQTKLHSEQQRLTAEENARQMREAYLAEMAKVQAEAADARRMAEKFADNETQRLRAEAYKQHIKMLEAEQPIPMDIDEEEAIAPPHDPDEFTIRLLTLPDAIATVIHDVNRQWIEANAERMRATLNAWLNEQRAMWQNDQVREIEAAKAAAKLHLPGPPPQFDSPAATQTYLQLTAPPTASTEEGGPAATAAPPSQKENIRDASTEEKVQTTSITPEEPETSTYQSIKATLGGDTSKAITAYGVIIHFSDVIKAKNAKLAAIPTATDEQRWAIKIKREATESNAIDVAIAQLQVKHGILLTKEQAQGWIEELLSAKAPQKRHRKGGTSLD